MIEMKWWLDEEEWDKGWLIPPEEERRVLVEMEPMTAEEFGLLTDLINMRYGEGE